jgi:hypothetical protein
VRCDLRHMRRAPPTTSRLPVWHQLMRTSLGVDAAECRKNGLWRQSRSLPHLVALAGHLVFV